MAGVTTAVASLTAAAYAVKLTAFIVISATALAHATIFFNVFIKQKVKK